MSVRWNLGLCAAFLGTVLCSQVNASIVSNFAYDNSLNQVTLTNREIILREVTPGTAGEILLPGGSYIEVVGVLGDLPQVGDVFVQIYDGTTLNVGGSPNSWSQTDTDRFEGYAAQQIKTVDTTPIGTIGAVLAITFETVTVDPFSILGTDEIIRLYVDEGVGATKFDETTSWQTGVDSVTNGVLWASFGTDVMPADTTQGGGTTLGYGLSNVTILQGAVSGQAFFGLNVISQPSGIVFTGVDDPGLTPDYDTSAYARANFVANINYPTDSAWRYISSDPFVFRAVPEPGSLLAWTMLLGVGVVVSRSRRKKRA